MEFVLFDVDENLRETTQHGSEEFPMAIYLQEIWRNKNGCVLLHWHNEMQFVIIQTGTVRYRVNQEDYLLTPGQALFISSNCLHSAKSVGNEYASYICIDIHPRFFGEYHSRISQRYVSPFLASKTLSAILVSGAEPWQKRATELLLKLVGVYEEKSFLYELRLQQICLEVLRLLLQRHRDSIEQPDATTIAEQERLNIILSYIHEHFAEHIALADIAAAANISQGECCRFFKRMLQITPMSYLNQFRVVQSASLLSNTSWSVAEISQRVGFCSSSYFTEKFKRMMNCKPTEYRNRFHRGK